MTDQTLLGVLSILRMDEGQGQSFMVKAILPDGKPRLVSRSFMQCLLSLLKLNAFIMLPNFARNRNTVPL